MNALMKGDYQFFKPGDEPLLFPLFQVDATIGLQLAKIADSGTHSLQ